MIVSKLIAGASFVPGAAVCARYPRSVVTDQRMQWTELSGGAPIDGVDPSELLGLQWQFNCSPVRCDVNMTIDDIAFILAWT
jgi:hypothetical protein